MSGLLFFNDLRLLPLLVPGLLLSLTVHEFAHARMALMFGDPTALRAGRCTLNPLAHLDPIGTFMILMVGFGWAKPVPVNPYLLRPPRLGDVMVSLAGVLSNIVLALISFLGLSILWKVGGVYDNGDGLGYIVQQSLYFIGLVNICLVLFNLIPLSPLDGHHVLGQLLPAAHRDGYTRWQAHYGRWVLMALWIVPPVMHNMGIPDFPNPLGMFMGYVGSHIVHFLLGVLM